MEFIRNLCKRFQTYSKIQNEKQLERDITVNNKMDDSLTDRTSQSIPLHNETTKIIDSEMETATYDNVKPFIPEIRTGKIIRVYDGDTVTIAARLHIDGVEIPKLFRYSVRLRRIDSPEMKTKNKTEKELAIKSRDALSLLIMGKTVSLTNVEYDKYGRILAEVLTEDGINVSDWMIQGGYAVLYDGGTKHRPAEWTDVEL